MRRIAVSLSLTLLAALALAPSVPAAGRLIIKGHGYGHGIGMSQYGALGFAQHGSTYREILGHYYEQTDIVPLTNAPDVRVLLQTTRRVVVSGVVAAGPGSAARKLNAKSTYSVGASGGRVSLYAASGRRLGTYPAPLRLAAVKGGAFRLRGAAANGTSNGRYRGALELRAAGGRLQAINALGLEDYVRGVISAESPSTWPAEALKAQAVAARTYALTSNIGTTTDGIDQYADTRSQMYKGVGAEYATTDAAVAATAGQVVAQNGKPVTTYFFSTSGGHTENVEDSFIGALPRTWLKGVVDPFDAVSPRHNWGPFTMSQATVQAKLKGLVRGSFRGITVLERGASPRIVRAEVNGTNGVTQVTGPQLRTRLGLFDTWASFTYVSGSKRQSSDDDGGEGEGEGGGGKTTEQPSTTVPASATVPGATVSPSSGGATPPAAGDGTGGAAPSP